MITSNIKKRARWREQKKRREEEPGHERSKKKRRGKKRERRGGGRGKEEASLTVVEVPRHLDALRSRGKFERSSVWTRVRHYVGIWGAQAARVHACAPPSDARACVCVRVRVCGDTCVLGGGTLYQVPSMRRYKLSGYPLRPRATNLIYIEKNLSPPLS